ncbi:tyrosine-type recombinase/integrase [Ferruginibacter sp. HRS2-29]|uniref:tyrosine-type recombinase/integrase n=1 Tax=Ferruginibacter sp. HRS2-29 TaxID=2487334 RepID=UPI0020CE04A3|nr:tyrosine-type recombinase/integrase [Ferruginibacter sp. HRS2-29]MCP9751488.1 integrase [Ferruginibacter sp. HRS2-29]MCP9751491.1 integrase [Ferruginibacter sp. HRS2-29]MCP9752231.1 integrase [Ferruginibacter sp. HRS2-29]
MISIELATKEFLCYCKFEKHLSEKTLKAYTTDLKQFNSFFITENLSMDVCDITKTELRRYLESLSTLKPKSIKRKIATIKAMFNYMEFDDQIDMNPMRKMRIKIREGKIIPKVMELKEIEKILKVVYQRKNVISDTQSYAFFEALRNIVVIELLFSTGARVSEISTLKTEQINVRSGEIMIKGKGKRERIIHVCNPELLSLLKTYKNLCIERMESGCNSFLLNRFSNEISTQSIRLLVNNLYKKAGINRHITPHVFRHSFATLLLEKDVDIKYIQEMLGHSSIAITQIYTHVNKTKQKHLLRTRHPRKDLFLSE